MAAAPSLYTASTGLCADSVESVPGCKGLFALATYQVDKHEQEHARSSSSPSSASPSSELPQSDEDEVEYTGENEVNESTSPAYTRRGTCSLYYAFSTQVDARRKVRCEKVDTIETPAILDMKWSLTRASDREKDDVRRVLGVANAKGQITLHRLTQEFTAEASGSKLQSIGNLQFNNRNALCLSLDFSDRTGGHNGGYNLHDLASDTSLIVSQSDGSLAYLPSLELALSNLSQTTVDRVTSELSSASLHESQRVEKARDGEHQDDHDDWDNSSEDERLAERESAHHLLNSAYPLKPAGLATWKAHEYEAWIAAFDCYTPTTVWSGGDDLTLYGWDVRTGPDSGHIPSPTFFCTKPFDGGVTSLQSHHLRQHIWAVGSYDSKLRLFDARMTARPLSETDVGGGVWRVKWHPTDADKLLVGCMHDGFKVLRLNQLNVQEVQPRDLRGEQFELVTRFDQHDSLAYGCDWDRALHINGTEEAQGRNVYSCSFYDATLHIWDSQTP